MPRLTLTAALLAAALLASACAGDAGPRGGSSRAGSESPEAAGDAGSADRVTVAIPADEGPLNLFAQHEEPLTELVYDKLLAPSPYVDDPQPWLAERVEQLDDVTWEVDLRDDVTWHDGEPFTADDVAFTVALFKRAPAGRWTHHVTDTPHITEVEVRDDTTVRFRCGYPCPFLGSVTLADLPIVPEHVWSGIEDPRSVTDLPVGTGPYRLTDYDADSGYVFAANPDHFAGTPVVDEITMPVIEDPSTAFTALRTGEVDAVARFVPPELVEQFRAAPEFTVIDTSPLQFPVLIMNYERAPFDRHAFRAAVAAAVDRDELLGTVWLGQGRAATRGYVHPDTPWSAPGIETAHDPKRARALLDGVGLTDGDGDGTRELDGEPISFTITVPGNEPTYVRAAELLSDQVADVGLEASVEQVDPGTLGALFSSRDFDAYVSGAPVHGVADPTQFIMSHESGYLWNLPEVPYPEMSALIDRWRAAGTIPDRTGLLFEMQRLFDTQPTHIPLYYPDGPMAFRTDAFAGWVESPGYGLFHKWSLLPRQVAAEAGAILDEAG